MFIKRDERKIPEILMDPKDDRSRLLLSKRAHEFDGKLDILCREGHVKQLKNLKLLSVYENQLESLHGIGLLAMTPLDELNVGNNLIKQIPPEMGGLSKLTSLWLDDNHLDEFPVVLCSLTTLTELRLSGNQIPHIPQSISVLKGLRTLSIDNNKLTEFPMGILDLLSLEHLWLRQNFIGELPDNLDKLINLVTLSVSSNELYSLPACINSMSSLKFLYANANKISTVDEDMCNALPFLEKLNLANNRVDTVPAAWVELWGPYNPEIGRLQLEDEGEHGDKKTVMITLVGNKLASAADVVAA
jgi:Leucine-rich repeat (LRR) protein